MKKALILGGTLLIGSFLLSGCIPPNPHVGKPAPHNYHFNSYGGYNGHYYYR